MNFNKNKKLACGRFFNLYNGNSTIVYNANNSMWQMYKVFFLCANILSTIAQMIPFCVPPPIDFGHFGLIFAKKVRIRSKKCTKCAV